MTVLIWLQQQVEAIGFLLSLRDGLEELANSRDCLWEDDPFISKTELFLLDRLCTLGACLDSPFASQIAFLVGAIDEEFGCDDLDLWSRSLSLLYIVQPWLLHDVIHQHVLNRVHSFNPLEAVDFYHVASLNLEMMHWRLLEIFIWVEVDFLVNIFQKLLDVDFFFVIWMIDSIYTGVTFLDLGVSLEILFLDLLVFVDLPYGIRVDVL